MNAILTTGFDQTFDKILAENENIAGLMQQVDGLSLNPQNTSLAPDTAVVRQPNRKKKTDRRALNFRKRKSKLKLPNFSDNYSKDDVPRALRSYRKYRKCYY